MTTSAYSSGMTDRNGFLLTEYDDEFHPIGKWIPFSQPKRPPFNPLGADFLATNGAHTYYFDDINHDIISYDSNSNDVNILMSFDLSNKMPEDILSDNMRFVTEQLNYNWVKNFTMVGSNIIVGYIFNGNQSISILDTKGKVVVSGKYQAPFPQCYPIDDITIISPVTVDFYMSYWEHQLDIPKPSFQVSEDTNLLLMKWKLSSQLHE